MCPQYCLVIMVIIVKESSQYSTTSGDNNCASEHPLRYAKKRTLPIRVLPTSARVNHQIHYQLINTYHKHSQCKINVDTRWHKMTKVRHMQYSLTSKNKWSIMKTYFYFAKSNVTLSPISINGAQSETFLKPLPLIHSMAWWRDSLALSPTTRCS